MSPSSEPLSVRRSSGTPLAPFTTFGIGGPATDLVEVDSGEQLGALAATLIAGDEIHLLGGGSNVLISDAGLAGTTVLLRSEHLGPAIGADHEGLVHLDGAWDWSGVAAELADAGIQGVETLCGIPGTVAGAVVQNIGAYGYELASVVHRVWAFDRTDGREVMLTVDECGFGYRSSRFKGDDRGRFLVLGVTLGLVPGGRHEVRYEELGRELGGAATDPSPTEVRDAVLAIRERKSMVHHPGDPLTRGVGSFFTNPVVTESQFEAIRSGTDTEVPHWPADGGIKLSGGWLIEQSGFIKGHGVGNVAISARHALAILNLTGEASAAEVIAFAGTIRTRVEDTFGVSLVPEPVFLGFPAGNPLS